MPDAWAFYLTLPPLDTAGLLSDLGSVEMVAASVLEYACLQARLDVQDTGALDIKIGSIAIKEAAGVSVLGVQADAWCKRAASLRGDAERTARRAAHLGSVSVPVVVR